MNIQSPYALPLNERESEEHNKQKNDRMQQDLKLYRSVDAILERRIVRILEKRSDWQANKGFIPDHAKYLVGHIKSVHKELMGENTSNSLTSQDVSNAQRLYSQELNILMRVTAMKNEGLSVEAIIAAIQE